MKFLKRVFLFFIFSITSISLFATHEMGGLITWDCLQNGQYVFRLQFYRDCSGTGFPPALNLTVYNNPNLNSIPVNLVQTIDRSTPCDTCTGTLPGRVEELVYESAPITLTGVPGPQGWTFAYNTCCRNPSMLNLNNPSTQGYSFRANMYSYNGQNADPCFDSSPRFADLPEFALCTGINQKLTNYSVDADMDSLVYEWAAAFQSFSTSVTYAMGFAYNSPFPDTSANPSNVSATLNKKTGELSFTSFNAGRFVSVVCVQAFKCGQLIAEVFREINTDLISGCLLQGSSNLNNPPLVTAPFPDSTGAFTLYDKIIVARDTVIFNMTSTDPDLDPALGGIQTVTMNGLSNQFIDSLIYPQNGCAFPPCAITTPGLPVSAPFGTSFNFEWITSCDHFIDSICQDTMEYAFSIRTNDNYCPVPASNNNTITIKLISPDAIKLDPPTIDSADLVSFPDVYIAWTAPADPFNVFEQYVIYQAPAPGGPWSVVDSISDINQTSYIGPSNPSYTPAIYFYMATQSRSCTSVFNESDPSNIETVLVHNIIEYLNDQILVYPNPTTNIIHFNYDFADYDIIYVDLFDNIGQLIRKYFFHNISQPKSISVKDLPHGLYVVRLYSNQGTFSSKFLKH